MSCTKKRLTNLSALAALIAVGFLCASGTKLAAQSSSVDLKNPALISRGSEVFAKSCAIGYCHGSEGRASRGPQLRERPWDPRHLYAVTRDGLPGTIMPAWKDLLPDHDIWAITAYVMSLSSTPLEGKAAVIELSEPLAAMQKRSADAQRGRELFFDLANERRCAVCHQLGAHGTAIGPDLAVSAKTKSADELLRDIVEPGASIAKGFEQISVATNDADRVAGVKKEETKEFVKVYDTSSIPPPLRTIYRDNIHAINPVKASAMPGDYQRVFSEQDLRAIVAYLKSGNY